MHFINFFITYMNKKWKKNKTKKKKKKKKKNQYFSQYFKSIWLNSPVWLYNFSYSILYTVRAEIFAVVLFSRISRVKPSRKFPLQFMSIYSNDNISKIAKLTTRELPHLAKTAKITVRENNGVYSNLIILMYTELIDVLLLTIKQENELSS